MTTNNISKGEKTMITLIILGVLVVVFAIANAAFASDGCDVVSFICGIVLIGLTFTFTVNLEKYEEEKNMRSCLSQTAIALKWSDNFTIERLLHVENGEIIFDHYLPTTIKKISQ